MAKDKNLQYWFCTIGPVDSKELLGWGADGPLRNAVEDKFIDIFSKQAEKCSSGWGLTLEMKTRLDIISLLPSLHKGDETLKQIDELLKKYK